MKKTKQERLIELAYIKLLITILKKTTTKGNKTK